MVKIKGLGRGLDALLGGDEKAAPAAGDATAMLSVNALQPGKYQPRSRMDQEALNALAASIKAQGVMQPILVRPVGGGKHEIIAGERRFRASKLAGLSEVPVLVRDVPDQAAAAMALLAETATGFCVGMNVPDDKLPLIKTLKVDYHKRSQGDMRAEAKLTPAQIQQLQTQDKGEVTVAVTITDASGQEPIQAEMIWAWVPKKRN